MKSDKIIIIGASGFGREVKGLIDQINMEKFRYEVLGFFDDDLDLPDIINGVPFLGSISEVNKIDYPCNIVIAIGDPKIKSKILERIVNPNIEFPNIIHPSAQIGNDSIQMGKGNIICAGVIITTNIIIDNFVILNLSCTVGHDTHLQSFCSFMPSVNISGEVQIEESVYVGTGAKIINNISIGRNTIVGAGAVVAKSLPINCTAVGIPAKPIKFNKE